MGEVSKRNADSFIQNSVSSPKKYSGHFRNDYACIWSSWNPLVSFLFWYNWWNGDSFHWSKVSINLLWTEILLGLGDSLVVLYHTHGRYILINQGEALTLVENETSNKPNYGFQQGCRYDLRYANLQAGFQIQGFD